MLRLALIALLFCAAPDLASAQSITVKITGQTEDSALTFKGKARVNLFSRQGKVTGALNTSETCTGETRINGKFTSGSGTLSCGPNLRASFVFQITSRVPLRGTGTAALADGRKATLRLWR